VSGQIVGKRTKTGPGGYRSQMSAPNYGFKRSKEMRNERIFKFDGTVLVQKSVDGCQNRIKIRKPEADHRQFKIQKDSIEASVNYRRSKEHISPEKLINFHPHEKTAFDFNQYGERGELFPPKISTQADYTY